jgi:hypothetical protein
MRYLSLIMTYQNINQYNFKKFGLKPVNEITDISLASDENGYDTEVVFSQNLIAEFDGNRMPFKFDFNNFETTICQNNDCDFDEDVIVSENYITPENYNSECDKTITICDVGLTGIDNGLVKNISGETIEVTTGIYGDNEDKFNRYKYDRRLKLHPITGFTTTENRLWDDDSYTYNLSFQNDDDSVGNYLKFDGGFYQGFYKLPGYDYEVFPERTNLGWTTEFLLRYRWTGDTNVGLNKRYPENTGTFFYMGARAENKFYHYAEGKYDDQTDRVTSELSCMKTCGCSDGESKCINVYPSSGGTITNCSCGCNCDCNSNAEYPEKDPMLDSISNAMSIKLSGNTGNPRLCVKTYTLNGDCEISGSCVTDTTYVTGTSVNEFCSSKGIFDICDSTNYTNQENWVQINAVFKRYNYLDECDVKQKGGLDLIVKSEYTATTANNSESLVKPPITTLEGEDSDYEPEKVEVVNFTNDWTAFKKYRLGDLNFYVNGRLFMVFKNFEEIIPRLLNVEKEKQVGVSHNISIGGGTQGLHDNLTISGGCSEDISQITYQQDPECLTTNELNNTIYSGLTTNITLSETFGGSFIGDISTFRMYSEPLSPPQIRHNFKLIKSRYNLLDYNCPKCY